jgi:hypothetical protein
VLIYLNRRLKRLIIHNKAAEAPDTIIYLGGKNENKNLLLPLPSFHMLEQLSPHIYTFKTKEKLFCQKNLTKMNISWSRKIDQTYCLYILLFLESLFFPKKAALDCL